MRAHYRGYLLDLLGQLTSPSAFAPPVIPSIFSNIIGWFRTLSVKQMTKRAATCHKSCMARCPAKHTRVEPTSIIHRSLPPPCIEGRHSQASSPVGSQPRHDHGPASRLHRELKPAELAGRVARRPFVSSNPRLIGSHQITDACTAALAGLPAQCEEGFLLAGSASRSSEQSGSPAPAAM